jgi:uncharacterized protein (DUF302 family)
MSYYLAKTVAQNFDETIQRVIAALKQEGFGVLSDIDVQATLKSKIGADMPRYRILGACNPHFAHQALQLENKLGVLLPCNVIVREQQPGHIEVAAVDPATSMGRVGNPRLIEVAEEVRSRLQRVIDSL